MWAAFWLCHSLSPSLFLSSLCLASEILKMIWFALRAVQAWWWWWWWWWTPKRVSERVSERVRKREMKRGRRWKERRARECWRWRQDIDHKTFCLDHVGQYGNDQLQTQFTHSDRAIWARKKIKSSSLLLSSGLLLSDRLARSTTTKADNLKNIKWSEFDYLSITCFLFWA